MSKTLIFGATGHIGEAVARQLIAEGRPVHLAGRDGTALPALAAELRASHSLFDLADPDTISKAVHEASTDGALGGLVWAVGSILLKPLARLTVSDFQDTYYINVIGAALAAQAAQKSLKAGKASMVFLVLSRPHKGSQTTPLSAQQKLLLKGLQRHWPQNWRQMSGSMSSLLL